MEELWAQLGSVDPSALEGARNEAHRAVQWVTRAARANLEAKPDDSHSNLGWRPANGALVSHDLPAPDGGSYNLGLVIGEMTLFIAEGGTRSAELDLTGLGDSDAGAWVDGELFRRGLNVADEVEIPYEIPELVGPYGASAAAAESAELGRWFAIAAELLDSVRGHLAGEVHTISPVRCWPHHFDIAATIQIDPHESPEQARSIGLGMAPGTAAIRNPTTM